jgi:pilus assembly protein CpaB
MNKRAVVVLVLAVVCGVSAAVGTSRLQGSGGNTVAVVTSKFDVSAGSKITRDMLEIKQWPRGMVPANSIADIEVAVDRVAIVKILQGDTVLEGKLAKPGSAAGLATMIPDGWRAYTIQTSKVASNVAGFILPKNRVDVILTLRGTHNDGTGGGSSTTLLQSIKILAIDQSLESPSENKTDPTELRSVTLLVKPRQAALLDLGQNLGQLTLSLRNSTDTSRADTEPATLAEIRFRQQPPTSEEGDSDIPDVLKQKIGKTYKIRTLRGLHSGTVSVTTSH